MKRLITLVAIALSFNFCIAQQLMFEVFSGVNSTAYDIDQYGDTKWHVPLGARIAGGHEHVQLGIEYRKNITHPVFDSEILRDEFDQQYYGGFIRANFSSLPVYRFGLVLRAGAGYYIDTHNIYVLPNENLDKSQEYDKVFGYNGGIGISSPIWTIIHWEIGYQYNYMKRNDELILQKYKASYHSFQMGVSLNLVFGNTAKKCRRTISGDRSNKGWK